MKTNYLKKRARVFKLLSNYTYDEKEPKTNKICKHKTTGIFFSYKEISGILKLSLMQTRRVIKEYIQIQTKEQRVRFVSHGNNNNQVRRKYDHDLETSISKYYQEFVEPLKTNEGLTVPFTIIDFILFLRNDKKLTDVSDSTIYRTLLKIGIISFYASRKIKKLMKKKLVRKENEFYKLMQEIIDFIPRKSCRKVQRNFGEIVELDGCVDEWIPGQKCYIHGAIDSSGYMLACSLDVEETNAGYSEMLLSLYQRYGIPNHFKTDKRSSFSGVSTPKLKQIMESFGSTINSQSFPTHKPNIERSWFNMQRSLKAYLKWINIKTYDELKDWVQNNLCDWYNQRFKKSRPTKSNFKFIDPITVKNKFVYSSVTRRCSHGIIKFENNYYYPVDSDGVRLTNIMQKVIVYRNMLTDEIFTKFRSEQINLIQCSKDDMIFVESEIQLENYYLRNKIDVLQKEKLTLEKALQAIKS